MGGGNARAEPHKSISAVASAGPSPFIEFHNETFIATLPCLFQGRILVVRIDRSCLRVDLRARRPRADVHRSVQAR